MGRPRGAGKGGESARPSGALDRAPWPGSPPGPGSRTRHGLANGTRAPVLQLGPAGPGSGARPGSLLRLALAPSGGDRGRRRHPAGGGEMLPRGLPGHPRRAPQAWRGSPARRPRSRGGRADRGRFRSLRSGRWFCTTAAWLQARPREAQTLAGPRRPPRAGRAARDGVSEPMPSTSWAGRASFGR